MQLISLAADTAEILRSQPYQIAPWQGHHSRIQLISKHPPQPAPAFLYGGFHSRSLATSCSQQLIVSRIVAFYCTVFIHLLYFFVEYEHIDTCNTPFDHCCSTDMRRRREHAATMQLKNR
jgi:hypothetical protein